MCTGRRHVVGAAYRVEDARPDVRANALAARPQHSCTCATLTAQSFHAFCICSNTRLGAKAQMRHPSTAADRVPTIATASAADPLKSYAKNI